MASSSASKQRDRAEALSRRSLIRWSLAAGAALGVSRSRVLEVLERSAGRGVAEAAAAVTTRRSVHIRAGVGGIAWFNLMWPHNAVARARNPAFSWHAVGQEVALDAHRPLTGGPATPFAAKPRDRQVTAIMAGINETHETNPTSIARAASGSSLFAIASSIQAANPSVVPVISIGDLVVGSAPGAPQPASVSSAAGFTGLFDSVASRAGALLAGEPNPELFRAHYAALAGLNRAATRSTTQLAYATGRGAARFVGVNLADKLALDATDLQRYGLDGSIVLRPELVELARTLAITVKAFQHGLTSCVLVPGIRDDPHTAFDLIGSTAPEGLNATVAGYQRVLDGFMTHLEATVDGDGVRLADDVVITIDGDTPKDPLSRSGWSDSTPANSNWLYVWSGGALKSGWFGRVDIDGSVTGFDPVSGADVPADPTRQARAAVAAIAHAIANGDRTRVQALVAEPYDALVA